MNKLQPLLELYETQLQQMLFRNIRNEIAHEYAVKDMNIFFQHIVQHTPLLIQIIQKVENYKQTKLG